MIGATSVSALVFAVVGVLLLAGALWKIGQLTIAPTDPGVRLVAACLSCLTIMFDLHGPVQEFVGTGTDLVLGPASPVLIRNLALLGSAYAAMGLLLYTGDDSARRTVLLQRGPTLTCALLLSIGWYSSVPAERFQDEPHPAALGMSVFWATGVLYTGYASGVIAVLLARRARRVEPRTAFGLCMAAMGWWGCVPFLTLPRLPAVLLGARGFTEPAALSTSAELLLRLTVGMMLVGLCIPALATRWAATRLWLTHRSLSKTLEPVWPVESSSAVLSPRGRVPRRPDPPRALRGPGCVLRWARRRGARALEGALRAYCDHRVAGLPGPVIAQPSGLSVEDDARALAELACPLGPRSSPPEHHLPRDPPPHRGDPTARGISDYQRRPRLARG